MSENVPPYVKAANRPLWSMLSALVLVALALLALAVVPPHRSDLLVVVIGMIVTTVPSLLAAGYAERTARDVRNGVVEQKAKDGATSALRETGVTDVVDATARGAGSVAAIAALSHLVGSDTVKRDALAKLLQTTIDAQTDTDPDRRADTV